MRTYFKGFERSNGFGTRNHILIIPTVTCSEITAKKMQLKASHFYNTADGKVKLLHNPFGCGQAGPDLELTTKTIINAGINPNVYGVVTVSLGCESVDYERVSDKISMYKPVYQVRLQDSDIKDAVEKGSNAIKNMANDAKKVIRTETEISNLVIGLHTGGSDYTSGLASNPVVGKVSDWIVDRGGTTITYFSASSAGAEQVYLKKVRNRDLKEKIMKEVCNFEEMLKKNEESDYRGGQPTPGNKDGGLSTVEEKALGTVRISGNSPIEGILEYADIPNRKGHFLMSGGGFDVESVSGRVSAGANIILFTTGRGTPTGNAISPVIKVTGNTVTARRMRSIIDFDCSSVISGEQGVEDNAHRLLELLIRVANGKLTKSELNGQDDFSIYRIGPTF